MRWKSFAALALTLAGGSHSAVAADSGSAELRLNAVAAGVCKMAEPNSTGAGGNTAVQGINITVNNLIKQDDATIQAWQATMNYPSVMCNYAAVLSIRSHNGGMKIVGPAVQPVSGDFLNEVEYTIKAKWGDLAEITLDTAANGTDPVSLEAPGAVQADLLVTMQAPASTLPLVKGEYQDIVYVKVGPTI
jgi:hypothetical protein